MAVMFLSLPIPFNDFVFSKKTLLTERSSMNTILTPNSNFRNRLFRYLDYIYVFYEGLRSYCIFKEIRIDINISQDANSAPHSQLRFCLVFRKGDSQNVHTTQTTALPAKQRKTLLSPSSFSRNLGKPSVEPQIIFPKGER